MDNKELKVRTKLFALRIIRLVDALPGTTGGRAIGNQIVRSGTSVGANYRAACRGRSKAEFTAIFTAAARTAQSKRANHTSHIKDQMPPSELPRKAATDEEESNITH